MKSVFFIWGTLAVVSTEIVVTYSRVPARELYHVSGSGIGLGLGRMTTFLNFPVALVALAVLALLWERLPGAGYRVAAVAAALLCAVVFWPGVVDEGNLDARPINIVPLIGVALTFVLTVAVARAAPLADPPWHRADWFRVGFIAVLLVVALPWLAAELGFYSNGVPLLGHLFRSREIWQSAPSVHHGHHHGMDGLLLIGTALLLSRLLGQVHRVGLRRALAAYFALMLCYGIGNYANDFWLEQIVKRGWTSWQIPSVLEPRLTVAWGLIVVASLIVWVLWARLVDWGSDEESPLRTESHGIPARR